MMKRCSRCSKTKSIADFYYLQRAFDGLDSWCKRCRIDYQDRYKEQAREYQRKYRLEHPEKRKEWLENNREHVIEYDRQRYKKDKAKRQKYIRTRNARLKSIEGEHTNEEWEDMLYACEYKCFACGAEDVELTKDHIIPVSKNGDDNIENLIPLCRSCNSKKGARGVEWYKQLLTESTFEEMRC